MVMERVDLQVDESGRDQLLRPGDQLLVRPLGRAARPHPLDQAALDEDAVRALDAVNPSAEQRAQAPPFSPSAIATSPFAAASRARAAAESMPQRSIRMATLAFPSASCRAASTLSSEHPVSSRTIRAARARSFWFAVTTPTIRPRYVYPSRMNTPVLIMLSVTFWAVPAFSRVEPATTSGPASISIATSAASPRGDPGAQLSPTTNEPARLASATAANTYSVRPLALTPTTASRVPRRARRASATPLPWSSSASPSPAACACTRSAGIPKVAGHSDASRTARRPLVPAPK